MSVLFNKDKNELIVSCRCGCEDSMHIRIDAEDPDMFAFVGYLNGNFYNDQNFTVFEVFRKKLKKIWAIIRNKDFYYSDIMMTQAEFEEFREFINSI